jgi:hypothetical protein
MGNQILLLLFREDGSAPEVMSCSVDELLLVVDDVVDVVDELVGWLDASAVNSKNFESRL